MRTILVVLLLCLSATLFAIALIIGLKVAIRELMKEIGHDD